MTAQEIESACRQALAADGDAALVEFNLHRPSHAEDGDDVPINPHMPGAPFGERIGVDDRGYEVARFFAREVLDWVTWRR
jgi:hypothetical protein